MKPTHFLGSSRRDIKEFPREVRQEIGFSLYAAEQGDKAVNAVPLVGFGGAKVLEILVPYDGDTFRAVYTVKFSHANYVLHAFQKKAKRGCKTPRADMDVIRSRLKQAERHYREKYEYQNAKGTGTDEKGAKGRS